MISGPETMTLVTVQVKCVLSDFVFFLSSSIRHVTSSLMKRLNFVESSFFKCSIYMDYAMDIMLDVI